MEIIQIEVGLLQNFNAIIADGDSGSCALVDPAFEVDRLLGLVRQHGWRVAAILVTHTHHDHIDGAEEAVAATGAPLYVGAGEADAAAKAAPSATIHGLQGGETIAVGAVSVQALATPGHTRAGISYVVPGAVFTGDTLFVGGCGRADFAGGDPRVLWRSLQRLCQLPEETRVYPGHDYGQTPTSTIGWEQTTNPYLLCRDEDAFVALRMGQNPHRPTRGPR